MACTTSRRESSSWTVSAERAPRSGNLSGNKSDASSSWREERRSALGLGFNGDLEADGEFVPLLLLRGLEMRGLPRIERILCRCGIMATRLVFSLLNKL